MRYKFNSPEMGAGKQAEMQGDGSGSAGSTSRATRRILKIPPTMDAGDV
jgi:hypothetical protein